MHDEITDDDAGANVRKYRNRNDSSAWLWDRLATVSALMLALLAGTLFAIGRQNRSAFLYQLGLDIYQVPDDFNGYALGGFGTVMNLAIVWLIGAGGAFFVIAALTWWVPPLRDWAKRRWRLFQRLTQWASESPEKTPKAYSKYAALGILAIISIYFVWLTRLVLVQAFDAGTRRGHNLIAALRADNENSTKQNTPWIELRFAAPRPVDAGYRLLCTDTLCSIYQSDEKSIAVIPLDGLIEMRVLDQRPAPTRANR